MNGKDIPLDLIQFKSDLKLKKEKGQVFIFDPVRDKYLVQTPEELVRQLVILYFEKILSWPKKLISVEKMLMVNERRKRFDILCFLPDGNPYILIECKSPRIPISQSTFDQASTYNITLKVPYLMVTNGINNYCCSIDLRSESYEFLKSVPTFQELCEKI